MLDAAILVNSHGISVSFIGDGPLMEPLKTRARIAAGPQLIRFHGALPDAASLLKAFDVLAISSRTEGSPIVLLEAIDAGVPVVATAVGGIPDIISENEAVLVAPEDGSALAAAILQLQQNPARATQLAAAARERVGRELGFDSWLDSYEEMYRAAIADRAAGA
jgi:glycosyltransferase involved in cell wall biosynthesis